MIHVVCSPKRIDTTLPARRERTILIDVGVEVAHLGIVTASSLHG